MPATPGRGVTPWRMPYTSEGTPRDKRIKKLSIHFQPSGTIASGEVADYIIRWEQPYDIDDNANGILDERTGMWIPAHAIVHTSAGRTAPEFGRNGEAEESAQEDKEFWNLWQ